MLDAIKFVAWGDCKIEHVLKYFMLSSSGKEIQASNLLCFVKIAIYTSGWLLISFFNLRFLLCQCVLFLWHLFFLFLVKSHVGARVAIFLEFKCNQIRSIKLSVIYTRASPFSSKCSLDVLVLLWDDIFAYNHFGDIY